MKMAHRTSRRDLLRNPRLFCRPGPESIPRRNPGVLKISHEKLRYVQSLSVMGTQQTLSQIRELCGQRLQTHTKEQMMELLVLERFLGTLPEEVRKWVRSRRPKNSREAGILVANLIQACREEGEPGRRPFATSTYGASAVCLACYRGEQRCVGWRRGCAASSWLTCLLQRGRHVVFGFCF